MIAHSILVLIAFLSCIGIPFALAVSTTQENEYRPDSRDETATGTHFLKG